MPAASPANHRRGDLPFRSTFQQCLTSLLPCSKSSNNAISVAMQSGINSSFDAISLFSSLPFFSNGLVDDEGSLYRLQNCAG